MADIVDAETRSRMMSKIRGKNTTPELVIRKYLHNRGFRYRLHVKSLPGKPDIVFPGRKAVIFVHGCFWHGHDCDLFRLPATRKEFWDSKIRKNRENDEKHIKKLVADGWRVLTVWECAIKRKSQLMTEGTGSSIISWLESDSKNNEIRKTP